MNKAKAKKAAENIRRYYWDTQGIKVETILVCVERPPGSRQYDYSARLEKPVIRWEAPHE